MPKPSRLKTFTCWKSRHANSDTGPWERLYWQRVRVTVAMKINKYPRYNFFRRWTFFTVRYTKWQLSLKNVIVSELKYYNDHFDRGLQAYSLESLATQPLPLPYGKKKKQTNKLSWCIRPRSAEVVITIMFGEIMTRVVRWYRRAFMRYRRAFKWNRRTFKRIYATVKPRAPYLYKCNNNVYLRREDGRSLNTAAVPEKPRQCVKS